MSTILLSWRISKTLTMQKPQMAFRIGSRRCNSSGPPSVLAEQVGRVMKITLNRPAVMNAQTAEMGDRLTEIVGDIGSKYGSVGAVVVTGAGRAFSAGGDLKFLEERHHDTPSRNAQLMRQFYQRFLNIRNLQVPVVAAINGPAVGAGLCFALACDVRIARPDAKLGVTFVGLNLHPGMGCTHFLPKIVGPQVAARMLLTGELVTGEQAYREGLVAALDEDPVAAAMAMASRMATQGPAAVRACVRTLRNQGDEGLEAALWREADAQAQCYPTADLMEGVSAVREKRSPDFKLYEDFKA